MMTRAMLLAGLAMGMAACSSSPSTDSSARNDATNDARSADTGMTSGKTKMQIADLSETDRQFVQQASSGGAYEVQASQLALQKTQDTHIRMIADHMIQDHTTANQQLNQLAQQKGLIANTAPNVDQNQMINELQGLNGPDFDQKYISQQTQAHKDTIALFQNEASNGNDPALKGWAAQTLPTLQQHLRMITGDNNNMSSEQR